MESGFFLVLQYISNLTMVRLLFWLKPYKSTDSVSQSHFLTQLFPHQSDVLNEIENTNVFVKSLWHC